MTTNARPTATLTVPILTKVRPVFSVDGVYKIRNCVTNTRFAFYGLSIIIDSICVINDFFNKKIQSIYYELKKLINPYMDCVVSNIAVSYICINRYG